MAKKLCLDIVTSVKSIDEYIGSKKDFKTFQQNKQLRRSVERELEIIGEAVNKLSRLVPPVYITHASQIISMRNRLIHGYDNIDEEIVWGVRGHQTSSCVTQ